MDVVQQADKPVDWGIANAKEGRNLRLVRRFKRLLTRYEPSVLVMEEFEENDPPRAERTKDLCRSLIHAAASVDMDTPLYCRNEVAACLGLLGTATRYQVAQAVVARLDAFSHRSPLKRKPWVSEDPLESLFDAAALALTHFAAHGIETPPAHPGAPK